MKTDNDFGILIAAADPEIRAALAEALGDVFHVRSVDSAAHIIEILEDKRYGAAFLGWGMPGLSLPELLEILADKRLRVHVVLVARESEMNLRADAIDAGAEAVLVYPFDSREPVAVAQKLKQAAIEEGYIRNFVLNAINELLDLMGDMDDSLKASVDRMMALALEDDPVLFQGEPGTGKGLLARVMVFSGSRPLGPFKEFSVRNKTPAEIENGLFGSGAKHGAIEKAKGGAVVIHGIGELPMRFQDKLCRSVEFLMGQERFIFISRIDLHGAVLRGEFHEELWKLIESNIVSVPSLKERTGVIDSLAKKMALRFAQRMDSPVREIHPSALGLLRSYPWPGNLAELERVIALAVGRAGGAILLPDDLPMVVSPKAAGRADDLSMEESIAARLAPLVDTVEDLPEGELYKLMIAKLERPLIKLVLNKLGGNQVKAAKALGIHRNTLRKKLKELGISPKSPF